jgi:K+-transporting ATPase ATPase C chain
MIALRTALVTLVLTGLVYPLTITGLAKLMFPRQADGSLVSDDKGTVVGSELIGQAFARPEYFQGRPSAANYDAANSTGSNLGTTSKKLQDRVNADVARLQKENPDAKEPIPADLVTASASGLDPHITPEAARWQVPRVAKARGLSEERVKQAVESQLEGRDVGFLGEPRINVLLLNLALDRQFGRR